MEGGRECKQGGVEKEGGRGGRGVKRRRGRGRGKGGGEEGEVKGAGNRDG